MAKQRYITEMGMGIDVHGRGYTEAAERAVFDAIQHSSLGFFKAAKKSPHDMIIEVLIGVPEPDAVDKEIVAKALPYGSVTVKTEKGGLEIPYEDGDDAIVIANAGILVHFDD
ncbi:MAG TPA: Lin0512 family protein [Pseudomonadales bacterium]|jgi:uncharacterized protein (TIGR02058 family)|nr:Lin0512 family protein [Pseudomonadales bacterium]MDP6316071.1 Lin0512 family protein [Pseudomonadales bacterium]MDP7316126.1 Lin0512 family protein [Pseudomonadales bacterium]MDP7575871.1 Lin0512 family protein [Pseudomonadales bacterium]HJL60855.1 Lin0512 family protein [Pseudomonadales bacterium]|tara:strand:+ start:491 stop:829 length:339 start_codon:yes stop_codon:yes gene_type:complete